LGKGLTAGPHLSATGAKEKGGEDVLGRRGCELGPTWAVLLARLRKRKRPAGLGWLRAKREEREREMGRLWIRERREERFSFFFLFNFIFQTFKLQSNKIHAFGS
jgi:hypothetical protein